MCRHRTRFIIISKLPPWTFSILVLGGIIWLTLGKPPYPPDGIRFWEHTDKVVHALMFGTLFAALAFDWYRRHPLDRPSISARPMSVIFPWTLVVGAIVEILQPEFGRSCDFLDFLADTAGVLIAWLLTPAFLRFLNR